MNDIAKEAGVSQATVSYIINKTVPVSKETEDQVMNAISKLGYSPGKQRKAKASKFIALIIPDISVGYYDDIVRKAERLINETGHTCFLCNTFYSQAVERQYANTLADLNVTGVLIAYSLISKEAVQTLIDAGIPIVTLDNKVEDQAIPSVEINNHSGSEAAIEHLYNMGARNICFVSEPLISQGLTDRFEGYKKTLERMGLPFDEKLCFIENRQYDKFDMGYNLGTNIVVNRMIDAVFVSSDSIAFGVVQQLKEHGIRIPDDIMIVGYDDDVFSSRLSPKLSSVAQPIGRMCSIGVRLLFDMIKGLELGDYERMLEPNLVIRESTIKPQ
jgi:DNA-binding LacI/PurR family transcriptional regulator